MIVFFRDKFKKELAFSQTGFLAAFLLTGMVISRGVNSYLAAPAGIARKTGLRICVKVI